MTYRTASQLTRWSGIALVAGGVLILILWPIYITAHGPTSFDRNISVFGQTTLFWGSLLGGLPNLILAAGLIGLGSVLKGPARSWAGVGYILLLIGLLVPAAMDLFTGSLGPPWFVPVVGIGSVMLAAANWRDRKLGRWAVYLLMTLGVIQTVALAWFFFVPKDVFD